jgi:hypothetical protein
LTSLGRLTSYFLIDGTATPSSTKTKPFKAPAGENHAARLDYQLVQAGSINANLARPLRPHDQLPSSPSISSPDDASAERQRPLLFLTEVFLIPLRKAAFRPNGVGAALGPE